MEGRSGSSPFINIHVSEDDESFIDVSVESVILMMEYLLQGAVSDFLGYVEGHENHENARTWLYFEGDSEDFMSLNNCCAVLGLSKDRVRFMAQRERDKKRTHFKAPHGEGGINQFDEFLKLCSL